MLDQVRLNYQLSDSPLALPVLIQLLLDPLADLLLSYVTCAPAVTQQSDNAGVRDLLSVKVSENFVWGTESLPQTLHLSTT